MTSWHDTCSSLPANARLAPVTIGTGPRLAIPHRVLAQAQAPAPLESPVVPGVFAALAIVGAVGVVLARRHVHGRWRKRLVTGGLVFGVLVSLLLGVAAGVNTYAGYLPTLASVAGAYPRPGAGDGTVVHLQLPDLALGVSDGETFVYLPAGYDDPVNRVRRYPVVYLLAGNPGTAVDWFRAGEAAVIAGYLIHWHVIRPMILVAPSTNNGAFEDYECANAVHGPQLGSYLTGPLVRDIDARFRTVADAAGRAIGGVSAGADCALNLALHHPSTYDVVVAHLPSGEPGPEAFHVAFHGNLHLYDVNAPVYYLRHHRPPRSLYFYLDAGGDDQRDVTRMMLLAAELRHDGQHVYTRIASHESHTWREGRAELPYSLDFVSQRFYEGGRRVVLADRSALRRLSCAARRTTIVVHPLEQLRRLHHVSTVSANPARGT